MDPSTAIVAALVAGVTASLKSTVEKAITESYTGIKEYIKSKYNGVDVAALEKKPDSKSRQETLKEELEDSAAGNDLELLNRAKELIELIERHSPESIGAIGVDLKNVKAAFLTIRQVASTGTGVKVEQGEFTGGISIDTVRAGNTVSPKD